jgi:hypothetical protein
MSPKPSKPVKPAKHPKQTGGGFFDFMKSTDGALPPLPGTEPVAAPAPVPSPSPSTDAPKPSLFQSFTSAFTKKADEVTPVVDATTAAATTQAGGKRKPVKPKPAPKPKAKPAAKAKAVKSKPKK